MKRKYLLLSALLAVCTIPLSACAEKETGKEESVPFEESIPRMPELDPGFPQPDPIFPIAPEEAESENPKASEKEEKDGKLPHAKRKRSKKHPPIPRPFPKPNI